MAKGRISERNLILPAAILLAASSTGQMQTSDLIDSLERILQPAGEDAKILKGRGDSKFSQIVRNLKSHDTLVKKGIATRVNGGFEITPYGKNWVASNL